MAPVRPPLRDRTILFLSRYSGFEEEVEVPFGLTQKGMARELGVKRAQVAQVLLELKGKDYVDERVRHVRGSPRRLKTYGLTANGRSYGDKLKKVVMKRNVKFTDKDGKVQDTTVKGVIDSYDGRIVLTDLLRVVDDSGCCDHQRIELLISGKGKEEDVEIGPDEEPVSEETPVSNGKIELEDWTKDWLTKEPEAEEVGTDEAGPQPPPPDLTEEQMKQQQAYYQYYQQYYSQYPRPPLRQPKVMRILFVIGFICMLAGVLMGFVAVVSYGDEMCCFGGLFLFVMGIVCIVGYYITLRQAKVEKLERRDRRMIIGSALILAYIMAYWASSAFDGDLWGEEEWRLALAINIPLLFALLAFFIIPKEVRGQIGYVIGTFLFSMSVGAWISLAVFEWLTLHPIMWMATGAMAIMVGNEIAGPTLKERALGVSTGLGLYMVFASLVLVHHVLTAEASEQITQAPTGVVAGIVLLWTALGIVIMFVRFTPEKNHEVLFQGLAVTAITCVGVGFMAFGVWFLRLARFEGAVDFLIAIPVIYYGLERLKGVKGGRLKVILMMLSFSIILEVLTIGLILNAF